MNLPLELLDLIIQDLAQEEDLDSVRTCCLTSMQLVHICRKYLFSSIKLIEDTERADTTKKFRRLLEQNPSLSSYVREVDIRLHMKYGSEEGLSFLSHLHLVGRFIIGFVNFSGRDGPQMKWRSLSKGLVDSLVSFIERNPITELCLSSIDGFPLSTFRLFSALKKVVLLNVTHSTVVGADSLITPIPLTSLHLRRGFIPFDQTLTLSSISFDLTGLKQLLIEVRYNDQNLDLLRRLLSMCDCLEVLGMVVHGYTNAPYLRNIAHYILPNSLKTLRNLDITLSIFEGENFPPYGCFEDELSLISGTNVLEQLDFKIISETDRVDPTHAATV